MELVDVLGFVRLGATTVHGTKVVAYIASTFNIQPSLIIITEVWYIDTQKFEHQNFAMCSSLVAPKVRFHSKNRLNLLGTLHVVSQI